MKTTLLAVSLAVGLLTSCSAVYKSGQTPDDVYYSPAREGGNRKEEQKQQQADERYEEYISSQDDRYLRMKVANRSRWTSIDDYDYWYDSRYDFGNYSYRSGWNNYSNFCNNNFNFGVSYGGVRRPFLGNGCGWNNPIYTLIGYSNPKVYAGSTTGSNITAYRNKGYNNTNSGYKDPKSGSWINTGNGNNNNFGNLVKRVFSSAVGTTQSGSYDRAARTFNNNSNSNSNNNSAPSSSAGGNSGGFKSTGTSSSTPRGGKNN